MTLKIRKDAPSGTIMIDRPDRRNALSRETIRELQNAFEDFQQERSVRAIILTGAGDTFSAGADLKQIQETVATGEPHQQWHSDAQEFQELIEYMLRFPKPIIASINGPIIGSALALMLACDIVVASERASFVDARTPTRTLLRTCRGATGISDRNRPSKLCFDNRANAGAQSLPRIGLIPRGRTRPPGLGAMSGTGWRNRQRCAALISLN